MVFDQTLFSATVQRAISDSKFPLFDIKHSHSRHPSFLGFENKGKNVLHLKMEGLKYRQPNWKKADFIEIICRVQASWRQPNKQFIRLKMSVFSK